MTRVAIIGAEPAARLVFSGGRHIMHDGLDDCRDRLRWELRLFSPIARALGHVGGQERDCHRVFAGEAA